MSRNFTNNYGDVLQYQNEVLGMVELNKDLDGYHDDYYISSLIMNDSPEHIRLPQRQRVDLDHINSLHIDERRMLVVAELKAHAADTQRGLGRHGREV